VSDLDAETYAVIARNVEANRRLQSLGPPDAPKERVMSLETVMEQRRKIAAISARLSERARRWSDGPRGED
jgi:hypothetical protein